MARVSPAVTNFADCMTIGEAAEFLGVSTATLRNWDRSGKLKPRRHPQNGYRIYLHEDLQCVLHSAELSAADDDSLTPQVDWSTIGPSEHFVQFYEHDEFLIASVAGFLAAALNRNDYGVVVATPEHRDGLRQRLIANGVDVAEAQAAGRYIVLDAQEALSKLMVGHKLDPGRFQATIVPLVSRLAETGRRVHAFGEMVALLWSEGNREAAIALEQQWSDLGKRHRFALFCAYPIDGFNGGEVLDAFNGVCGCHSRVIPAESYSAVADSDERLRAISLLQQKAHSLQTEIEHRHVVEKALSQRERELADFFENATEGLHKVGGDGTILWANKAEYELLGYTEDEYVGRSIKDFHADADVIENILQMLGRGETLVNFPARLRCKSGAIKHVLISSNAYIENGELFYTRCFTRDVTEQWRAEKNLLEADRRKDEFLATLSHELRNPLAPIRNAIELLDRSGGDVDAMRDAVNIVRRQVTQLTRLVDDLLDISRITRDKLELRKQDIELGLIINSAIEASRPGIHAAGLRLQVSLPDEPVRLHADPARLAQVLSNLLNNAAKFTPPGGLIQLDARQVDREAVISVRDNGVGISCEALAYVFDMFRQADESLERSQGGLGIGLTLVRRLVELHEGTVNAQSEGPGKGSEFTARLPVAGAKREAKSRRPAKEAPAVKRRILVVDDNKDAGDTMCILLRHKGHDVWTARDGLEAIAKAGELEPDIILMDLGMPKLNGYDATRRIRETKSGQGIYIVALTGWGQPGDIAKSLEAGCSAHLVKPVDFAALDELLANAPASS
jgi:PAS domain S-box-containing protein